MHDTWEELSKEEEFIVAQELSWIKNISLIVCSVVKVPRLWSGMNTGFMRSVFRKAHVLLEPLGSTALTEDALLTRLHSELAPLTMHVAELDLVSVGD